jgi:hypothetical protein
MIFDRELKNKLDALTTQVQRLEDRLDKAEAELREWRKVWATQTQRSRRITAAGMSSYLRRLEAEDEKRAESQPRTAVEAEQSMKERDANAS